MNFLKNNEGTYNALLRANGEFARLIRTFEEEKGSYEKIDENAETQTPSASTSSINQPPENDLISISSKVDCHVSRTKFEMSNFEQPISNIKRRDSKKSPGSLERKSNSFRRSKSGSTMAEDRAHIQKELESNQNKGQLVEEEKMAIGFNQIFMLMNKLILLYVKNLKFQINF